MLRNKLTTYVYESGSEGAMCLRAVYINKDDITTCLWVSTLDCNDSQRYTRDVRNIDWPKVSHLPYHHDADRYPDLYKKI